jgi:dipicolinate synthase subunit A
MTLLSGKHLVVLGGDARQVEVIQRLQEWDASIETFGFDTTQIRLTNCTQNEWNETQAQQALMRADGIVLPIISCDDEQRIDAPYSSEEIHMNERCWRMMRKDSFIFTGVATTPFINQAKLHDLQYIELLSRDDVAIFNSIPTAEGAVMLAIQHTSITIHHAEIVVLGFGRIGMTLARVLAAMGANVSVGVKTPEQFARAFEMGLKPFYSVEIERKVGGIDLLFNTIPSMIVTAQIIVQMPLSAVIIDLASKPGGVDFRFAEKRGIKALLAPGLPGLVAPRTAGRILADRIHQFLINPMERTGEYQ